MLLPVPLFTLFDYRLSDKLTIGVGQRVLVEFGKRKHQIGIVAAIRNEIATDKENNDLKLVSSILDNFPIVDEYWLDFIRFASRYYVEPLGKVFKNALPARLRVNESVVIPSEKVFSLNNEGKAAVLNDILPANAKKQRALLALLYQKKCASEAELRESGFAKSDWHKLSEKGYLQIIKRSPFLDNTPVVSPSYGLNTEQQAIIDDLSATSDNYHGHLIYGVTGSGKTEVYIKLIEKVLMGGQQVLLLVPEIGLTPQMLSRFRQRFGRRVAIYHSGMTDNARRELFLSAFSGELPILIGTRSAIFLPFKSLGLILIDEEHDLSYKQQEGVLYHARDLAMYRANRLGITVVMGSATPSLESMQNVKQGKLRLHYLTYRATETTLPDIVMVDRRGHSREQVLADKVQQKMRQVLQSGKQVLLFLNRRGFSSIMMCGSCGWSSGCPACSVYQTAHLMTRQLCCHHCGHQQPLPIRCPDCGDKKEL
ncbi:MAG: replication restart helicase PriA, partial [Ostreibacterium sp.]